MDKNSALCPQHPKRDQNVCNFYSSGGRPQAPPTSAYGSPYLPPPPPPHDTVPLR